MGWRFRKSVKIAPGTRLNLSKSGVSVTNRVGKTGLSHRTQIFGGEKNSKKTNRGCLSSIIGFLLILGLLGSCSNKGKTEEQLAAPTDAILAETTEATAETAEPTQAPTEQPEPTEEGLKIITPEPTLNPVEELRQKIDDLKAKVENGEEIEQTFVLNTNTKKFHSTTCSEVSSINAENRQYYTGVRSDVIRMGYNPCGRCMK